MLAKITLSVLGYKIDKSLYEVCKKQRVIIFPHTTKIESIIGCLALIATNNSNNVCFPVAPEYMEAPIIGSILKHFGGVKVLYGTGMTNNMIEYMKQNKHKQFVISPEGSLVAGEWKSGFFYIAKGINAPICIGGIDFVNHIVKLLDVEFEIKTDNTYENKVNDIKTAFANSKLYPLYPLKSNPYIFMSEGLKPYPIPINRIILFSFTFLVFTTIIINQIYN